MLSGFFYLPKSDRKVLVALLVVATVALGIIYFSGGDETTGVPEGLDSLTGERLGMGDSGGWHGGRGGGWHGSGSRAPAYYRTEGRTVRLFPFDPNTADSTQLLSLGLQPFQVRNVYRYRAHGGIYRKPEDFARVYGLTAGEYQRLKPYIRIGQDYRPAKELAEVKRVEAKPFGLDSVIYPEKIAQGERIVLNTADSAALRSVPGIGVHFAHQIISYGRRLGGYVSVDQLDEIDYFPTEAKQYFTISQPVTRRLNVNKLSLSQLRQHPYIGFRQAKTIVDYRRLHGRISSLSQLSLSPDFTPEVIRRLEPYVEY